MYIQYPLNPLLVTTRIFSGGGGGSRPRPCLWLAKDMATAARLHYNLLSGAGAFRFQGRVLPITQNNDSKNASEMTKILPIYLPARFCLG